MSQVVVKRFFGKKRGSRNMRSDKLGGASLGIFFAVFLIVGCVALGLVLGQLTIPDWRSNFTFLPAQCRVLDKQLDQARSGASVLYRPEILIRYTVAGQVYEAWTYSIGRIYTSDEKWCRAVLERFVVGAEYPCWYDPQNPENVVLVRKHSWFAWLALVLPVSFLAIGSTGLAYTLLNWNKSTERRAVLARRAAELDPLESISDADELFPHVPGHSHLTNSPGTMLRYRLPQASPSWTLVGMIAVAVAWNVAVLALAALALRRYEAGRPDWVFIGLLAPLSALGVGLVVVTARRFVAATEVGSTIVEIDQHPLYPGGKYKLYLSQSGRLRLRELRMLLVCEEEVKYLQGTDLRAARQRVQEVPLYRAADIEISRGQEHETRCSFEVPGTAMHSFHGNYNRVAWKLLVRCELLDGHAFERTYSLSVYPRGTARFVPGLRPARSGRT